MKKDTSVIPSSAWKRRFDEQPLKPWKGAKFSLREAITFLPVAGRVMKNIREDVKNGRPPLMDAVTGLKISPDMGVPLGGLGGGTVTRGFRGDFSRWQMQPGMVHYGAVAADQFSLWAQRPNSEAGCVVLNPRTAPADSLQAWNWGMPADKGTYHALFPRAWSTYAEPLPGLRLTCRQVSPVIPHNYKESSFPVGVFAWTVENTGETDADISLMFSFQNGTGKENDILGGHSNRPIRSQNLVGVELQHVHRLARPGKKGSEKTYFEDPLTFAIGVKAEKDVQVTTCSRFVTNADGKEVWADFAGDGRLENTADERRSTAGESIGAAVAVRVHLQAGESAQIVFGLAWDMPVARFGLGTGWYRRYTRFLGQDGKAAPKLLQSALTDYPAWEAAIEQWQKPILENPELPDWYKGMLFNETYYLVDGGTIWTAGKEGGISTANDPLPEPEIGHFAYLESYEYRMYNTYDVHFYASFALAMLWPEIEIGLQRDFIHSLDVEHPEIYKMLLSGHIAPRKVRGSIPHDLGSPTADPWAKVNAYIMQDVSRWKDLNPKFVLQIYRDYLLTRDRAFLAEAWPAVRDSMVYMQQFDRDGDGLVENDNFPDQTYDTWPVKGASAYTGGLWLACLQAAAAIAEAMGEADNAGAYRRQFKQAQAAYERLLWNGEYYNYDASNSKVHDSIMADQLAGHWFSRACGLGGIVSPEHARAALKKIFDFNVMKFWNGEGGALNGMRPNGLPDKSNLQSLETWIGVTFSVAACMLQEGLRSEAFTTAQGVQISIYRDIGLFFQTPEALRLDAGHRAVGYMRPLSIWAMQWELEDKIKGR
jgi:non-lysosomal glucosylceramidase